MKIYVWFDSFIKTRSGKRIPYYDYAIVERQLKDQELRWFHEGYGTMVLYRLWKVDDENYIAENLQKYCRAGSPDWERYCSNPESLLT